jgi:hypothetical protein
VGERRNRQLKGGGGDFGMQQIGREIISITLFNSLGHLRRYMAADIILFFCSLRRQPEWLLSLPEEGSRAGFRKVVFYKNESRDIVQTRRLC